MITTQNMLSLQNDMNRIVHPEWQVQKFAWHRAIWLEAGEAVEHYAAWKWWKKAEGDINQIRLELVDIWHFGMSALIEKYGLQGAATIIDLEVSMFDEHNDKKSITLFPEEIEALVIKVMTGNVFPIGDFFNLIVMLDMDYNDLYRMYIGKNMLNRFRQENGYKDNTYIKVWDNREDNIHLIEICDQLDINDDRFPMMVLKGLSERYIELTA